MNKPAGKQPPPESKHMPPMCTHQPICIRTSSKAWPKAKGLFVYLLFAIARSHRSESNAWHRGVGFNILLPLLYIYTYLTSQALWGFKDGGGYVARWLQSESLRLPNVSSG